MEEYRRISDQERKRRKSLEALKKAQKRKKIRNAAVSTLVIFCAAVFGIYLCYTKFFTINKCVIKGDCQYTQEQVLQGAGLYKGMLLYELDKKTVEKNVKYNLPFIDSFEYKRYWPGTVVFEVIEAVPTMYITIGDENFVLSQSLRVLSQTRDFTYIESMHLMHIRTNDVERCVAGEFIKARNNTDKTIVELYSVLVSQKIENDVSEINLDDRFNISFTYKNNFELRYVPLWQIP